jgi:hypothetical protein
MHSDRDEVLNLLGMKNSRMDKRVVDVTCSTSIVKSPGILLADQEQCSWRQNQRSREAYTSATQRIACIVEEIVSSTKPTLR